MTRLLAVLILAAGLCLAQAPGAGAEAHVSRGTKLMLDRLFEAAAAEFEQAVALDPADASARFQFAVCLLALGRRDEARRHFEQVRQQAGDLPLVTYYLGRLDLLAGDYPSATKRLASVADDPPLPDTAFYLGVAYVAAGDLEAGLKWLERVVKAEPRDWRAHYRLGRVYSSVGREKEAIREYDLYNKFRDDVKDTEIAARACTGALRAKSATAQEICQRMYDPNDPEKLTLLGQLFGDGSAYAQALDPLRRAVELDPKSFEAWHNLGVTYFRLQRYAEARAPLEKAVSLRSEFYGSVVLLGATLYMLGDDAAALPVLERAHRLNPADAETAAVLEKLRAAQGKK